MRRVISIIVIAGLLLVGATVSAEAGKARRISRISHGVNVALNQIGDPYVYGASGPRSYDCSGLVYYGYHKRGPRFHMPRSAAAQYQRVRHIPKRRMKRGDFLYYYDSGGHVYHTAIFLGWRHGRRRVLEAAHTGTNVRRSTPWTSRWRAGTLRYWEGH